MDDRERDTILEELRSEDAELRRLAVEQLPGLGAETAVPRLVECLGDSSWRVRKAAIDRLVDGAFAAAAVPLLIEALADGENPGRRNAAVEALTRYGGSALPALVEASRDADADVRKQVVDALAGIGDERAAERLEAMLADEDPNVRGAAADALGGLETAPAAAPLLRTASEDPERLVRLSALRALARMEASVPPARVAGALEDPLLRPACFALLGRSDAPEAAEALLKGLGSDSRASREAAMEALLHAMASAEPAAAERLAERVRQVASEHSGLVPDALERLEGAALATRLVLVQFLGVLRRSDCVLPLLEAGRDEALAEVALSALEACGEAAERELDAGWSHLDPEARVLACALLARTRGGVGAARLGAALADPDPELRIAAARALGRRAEPGALPELVGRLEAAAGDAEPEELEALVEAIVAVALSGAEAGGVAADLLTARLDAGAERFRAAAVSALGRIGRGRDAEAVGALLSDPAAEVRRAAVEALPRVAPGGVPEPLRLALADEAASVRIAAAGALAASGDLRALDDLAHLARDEDARVRGAAARGVGACLAAAGTAAAEARAGEGFALLERALRDEETVALAALEALGTAGGSEAARVALPALGSPDPDLAKAAVDCVREHGEAELLPELFAALGHDHWVVRAEAVQALAERGVERAVPALLRRIEVEQDDFVRTALLSALDRLER